MLLHHVINVAQPVVHKAYTVPLKGGPDTSTSVVTADDDVFYLKNIDRKLHHGERVKVRVNDHIGHIAVHEDIPRCKTHEFLGRHATIRAADPEVLWSLLNGEILKELRVFGDEIPGPFLVVVKKFG